MIDVGGATLGRVPTAGPPVTPGQAAELNVPAPPRSLVGESGFGTGFTITSENEEFQLQFHNLTQIDYRGYWPTPRAPLNEIYHSTFGLPRQWWIFSGRLTKQIEYFAVPAFGFDNINLLDGFINLRYDDRFQFKIGRYKTPYMYEFYNLPINGLINPERSLFFNNFALNRDTGAMLWGQLFDKRIDYSAGIFNGSRNFYVDRNSSPIVATYLNARPFGGDVGSPLEFFNIGGSVMSGNESNRPIPTVLRTNVATTGASFFGVPFLAYNADVIEYGPRVLWDLHVAWYYRQLSLIAEWSSGIQSYGRIPNPSVGNRTRLPVSGYYVQAGYFLTGETVSTRGAVRPRRDFNPKPGQVAPGAIELAARWSSLTLGEEVFTNGLADPNLWTREAGLLDVGVNWYLTQYLKVYFGWQRAVFANPVILDPGRYQQENDMLWLRFQLYF